ncbi:Ribonuclease P protein component [Nitrospira japonica]|uniref:Ribonuclease P protein component n=1 Tax=Nitrospira japonica TaxID=1325564 RepID=A0A1W1I3J8_9BACT|nr:ribonuclease P protein component [Nitrospira japonica]SLM47578.1 Ribonuclease P protein component [Nitrospira japonica]
MTGIRRERRERFLRASRDINYVKQHGRRLSTSLFNLLICKIEGTKTRVGIVVGRRFGPAVRRNRAKRLFRELTRHASEHLVEGYALLVFPKREVLELPFERLRAIWCSTLSRQRLFRSEAEASRPV